LEQTDVEEPTDTVGAAMTFTVPLTALVEQVMPEAIFCGVAVTVYAPGVLPVTVIEEEDEEPVKPVGKDQV
jgi:hypothetical protein